MPYKLILQVIALVLVAGQAVQAAELLPAGVAVKLLAVVLTTLAGWQALVLQWKTKDVNNSLNGGGK